MQTHRPDLGANRNTVEMTTYTLSTLSVPNPSKKIKRLTPSSFDAAAVGRGSSPQRVVAMPGADRSSTLLMPANGEVVRL